MRSCVSIDLVEEELQLGHASQPQPPAELAAEERRRALERPRGLPPRLLVAERRVVDARELQVGGDLDAGERQEADARIVHLARLSIPRQLDADLIADALRA